ncbi:OmpA family protein [Paenirhodobacter sp.]|uniref:OmpA family protein n=1 Tax=Paenirhodobacter sp. TaxID=1965326 RepID=UPI003B3C90E2
MLRNDDGISLIGLVPATTDREKLVASLRAAIGGTVVDMLETADYPAPAGWDRAMNFGLETIRTLPRSKISVDPGRVAVQAIADSPADKVRIETALARRRPADLELAPEISAPRPVITPFTLRFVIDGEGARFDACSADTERARDRILTAAREAGAEGAQGCTIGMGTPSPQWADAVVMALGALKGMGQGTLTFSDADISLVAAPSVAAEVYDDTVGRLESNLPAVFSLKAEHEKPEQEATAQPQFSALRGEDGKVDLRGRLPDARARTALESLARARFGADAVRGATRLDETLPNGWQVRTMAALEALAALSRGSVTVTPDLVRVSGVTGNPQASDTVARLLAHRLGEDAPISLSIRYDRRLDPVLGLPDGPECVERLNGVLKARKITFEPGSAVIDKGTSGTMDALAAAMKDCEDFGMEIAGHTDSQGRDEMNLALSQSRADAVLAGLAERRVLTGNLTAKGYGETQPIADNKTEAGREENRRIEFVLLDANPVVTPPPADPPENPREDEPTGAPMGEEGELPPEQDPAIAIPVAPAQESPAQPEQRPDGLQTQP